LNAPAGVICHVLKKKDDIPGNRVPSYSNKQKKEWVKDKFSADCSMSDKLMIKYFFFMAGFIRFLQEKN